MNQSNKTLTVIILICLTFSTLSGTIVFVQACDPASKLFFSAGAPQVLQAGTVSNQITVQLRDASNNSVNALSDITVNLVTNASSSGHFYSDQNGKNQISGITIKQGQNSANFYYKDTLAGHPTLTASSGTLTPASKTFTINASSATKLIISAGGSQTLSAGQVSKALVVQRQDQYGNPTTLGGPIVISLSTTSGSGTFYSDSSGASSITSININALATDSTGFYYADTIAGHPTLTAASAGLTAATTIFSITFAASGATHFVVSAPTSATAGSAFSLTVTAEDIYGNIVSGYSGTVHFTSSDGQAVLPADSVLASGVTTFSVTLETAGSQIVTATDTGNSAITGIATLSVVPTDLNYIVISPKTSTITAGGSQVFSVEAFDQYGNSLGGVTDSSSFNVNGVSITGNSVSETSVGSYSVIAAYNGQTDSATLTVTGYTVTFTNSGLPTGTAWSITFDNTVYSSTTNTITITDVSAITYSWSTATYIQIYGTRYVAAQTSGSITVPSQVSQNIEYSTQYLVTYATTGNVLPITSPADEWVNSGSAATGIFTQQIINSAQTIRCNLINDNRTSITQPTTVMATYQTQYYITITSAHGSPTQASQWVNAGSSITVSVTSPDGNAVDRWICIGYSLDNAVPTSGTSYAFTNVQASHSIAFNWQEQYYLTVTSPYSTPSGAGWYNAGSTATASVASGTVSGTTGTQYVFTGWSDDASGINYAQSNTITMNSPKTATANWKTQYYLTITSIYESPSGQGWYDAGSAANIAVTQTVSSWTSSRYVFSAWSGSGSDAYTGSSATTYIIMNGPITETAIWRTQYLVTYTVIGNAISVSVPSNEWTTAGTAAKGTFSPTIANQANDTQCIFIKDNRTSTITQPTLITGTYQTQYAVNFSQNGLETDAVGTILTILGIEKDYSQLANITWVNNGTQVTFTFANTVASTIANKLYTLTGINATSPLMIDAPTLVQGNYQPQYSASLFTVAEFALIIFALLLLLLLLLAWRRRRKKKQ